LPAPPYRPSLAFGFTLPLSFTEANPNNTRTLNEAKPLYCAVMILKFSKRSQLFPTAPERYQTVIIITKRELFVPNDRKTDQTGNGVPGL